MGVDYSVHIGPYLTVHDPEGPSTFEFYTCVNPQCEDRFKEQSSKFCPKCGKPIELYKKACKARKSENFDIYDELKERLIEEFSDYKPRHLENHLVLVSNVRGHDTSFDPTECDSMAMDLSTVNVKADTEKFEKSFAKEIEKLKEFFGQKAVEVHWGVISYAY